MPQTRGDVSISVKGLKKVLKNLKLSEDTLVSEAGKALYAEGRETIEETIPLVPTETGALLASRFTTPPIRSGGELRVICGFGTDKVINPKSRRPTSQYAIFVHERTDVNHPRGEAKFLEKVMIRRAPTLEQRVANRIATKFRGR